MSLCLIYDKKPLFRRLFCACIWERANDQKSSLRCTFTVLILQNFTFFCIRDCCFGSLSDPESNKNGCFWRSFSELAKQAALNPIDRVKLGRTVLFHDISEYES